MNTGDIVALAMAVISLLSTFVGGAMAWQKIKDRSDENRKRVDELEKRLGEHDGLTTKLAVLSERLVWIQRQFKVRSGRSSEHCDGDDSDDA